MVLWLILVLLVAGIALVVPVAWYMAEALIRPPRMTDGKALYLLKRLSPADLSLHFESADFQVEDVRSGGRLRIAGWWISSARPSERCVLLLHGYADAKVGSIAWAPVFHGADCNILAIDLRAHGESGGRLSTAGILEQHDIEQVLNQIRGRFPEQTRQCMIFGVSYGTAIAARVAAERDDLAGVILDSPFVDFRHAAMAQYDLIGLPGRWVQRLALHMAEWRIGGSFADRRPVDLLEQIAAPLMVIETGLDPFVPEGDRRQIEAALKRREQAGRMTTYWHLPQTPHLLANQLHPEEYRRRIGQFISAAMRRADPQLRTNL